MSNRWSHGRHKKEYDEEEEYKKLMELVRSSEPSPSKRDEMDVDSPQEGSQTLPKSRKHKKSTKSFAEMESPTPKRAKTRKNRSQDQNSDHGDENSGQKTSKSPLYPSFPTPSSVSRKNTKINKTSNCNATVIETSHNSESIGDQFSSSRPNNCAESSARTIRKRREESTASLSSPSFGYSPTHSTSPKYSRTSDPVKSHYLQMLSTPHEGSSQHKKKKKKSKDSHMNTTGRPKEEKKKDRNEKEEEEMIEDTELFEMEDISNHLEVAAQKTNEGKQEKEETPSQMNRGKEEIETVEKEPKTYKCLFCSKDNYSPSRLASHVLRKHSKENRSPRQICPICASRPGGDPSFVSSDIFGHLKLRHLEHSVELSSLLRSRSSLFSFRTADLITQTRRSSFLGGSLQRMMGGDKDIHDILWDYGNARDASADPRVSFTSSLTRLPCDKCHSEVPSSVPRSVLACGHTFHPQCLDDIPNPPCPKCDRTSKKKKKSKKNKRK